MEFFLKLTSFNFLFIYEVTDNNLYLITYIIGIATIVVLFIFVKAMPRRTSFGNKMLGRARGFKKFLETAEKEQLESLVAQNPEYFYNILPYTYAMDVSDLWIRQFEEIAVEAPKWYDAPHDFDRHTFSSFINSTISSASTAMSSVPSSNNRNSRDMSSSGGDSSGGGSGGGSSGGGSGGGGGGSW